MQKFRMTEKTLASIKSLRQRTVLFGFISVVIIACILVGFLLQLRSIVEDSNLRELSELSQEETNVVTTYLETQWDSLEHIGQRLAANGEVTSTLAANSLELERAASEFYDLFLVDSAGNISFRAIGGGKIDDTTDSGDAQVIPTVSDADEADNMDALEYLIAQKGMQRSVFHLYNDEGEALGGVETVYFSVELTTPLVIDGVEYVGIVGRTSIAQVRESMTMQCFGGEGYSSIVDESGYYLASPHSEVGNYITDNIFDDLLSVGTPDYQVNIFKQQVQNGETFSANLAGFSDARLISSFSPIDSTGWYYVISVPSEIVYAERHEVVVLSLIMVVGVVLVVAALAGITVYTAREELLAKAQAEVRSNFLNNMSHELRTPLNSLIGLNYLMRENLDDPEKLEQYLEKENETASYLKNLVDDVLDVSKLQAKGVKLELAPVDLNELLASISDMVQISVEEKGLEYICDCHFERPLVMLDEVRVKQILMNILGNALKFTDHGSVRFEARQAFYVGSNTVSTVFSVTDTGCGISEEFLPHVFDAFEQEEGKVGAYLKGTGLGMPISKMLAEQMGGRIMVSSVEGKGTCFVVDLPAECVDEVPEVVDAGKAEVRLAPNAGVCGCESGVRAALRGAVSGAGAGAGAEGVTGNMASGLVLGAQSDGEGVTGGVGEGAEAADAAKGNGERRILLAEDNELNALIMSEILRGAGFNVMVATDGGQTVRLFDKMPVGYFDLVLVDWQMPVYDGITATRLIRSLDRPDAATVPIFMCTANATQENKEEAMANGMTAFLSKPIDVKEVLSLLNSVGQ